MVTYSPNAWASYELWSMGLMGLALVVVVIGAVMAARQLRGR